MVGGVLVFSLGLFLVDLGRRLSATEVQPLVTVVALMSPLVIVLYGITQVFRLIALPKPWTVALLGSTGLAFLGLGGWLVQNGGLLSLDGWSLSLCGGMLCIDFGMGSVVLAAAAGLRRTEEPDVGERATRSIHVDRRKIGGYVLGTGHGLLLAGYRWAVETHPVPSFVPLLCGVGAALVVIGLYLLIGRSGERVQEFGRGPSNS